jgi:cytochrome c oxidase cbb3-type subunit III
MRTYIAVVVASILSLPLAGCKQQSVAEAPMGTPPPVRIPIGPVPGPGNKLENLPANPYEGDQVAMVEGRRLFIWFNCYGCHGGHGGGGMGPSLRDPKWIYGGAPAEIFSSIAEGRAKGMPAWGTKIPEDEIWKLVTYINSMRTPQEPDPPLVAPEPVVPHPNSARDQTAANQPPGSNKP